MRRMLAPALLLLLGFILRSDSALVPSAPLILDYHGGRLLTGRGTLSVYLLWYGDFTDTQKSILADFITSISSDSAPPSTSGFWKIISSYTDARSNPVKRRVKLAGQVNVGRPRISNTLLRADIPTVISTALYDARLPAHAQSLYLLITASDVAVERFCMNTCAFHAYLNGSSARGPRLPYAWVGNPAVQCPGMCAWPFALPAYGPRGQAALAPPNGDAGMDGVVINTALMLAGAATNPFGDGYYQGDASVPLEAGTACTGIFGTGSYPGYPGELLVDKTSGSSYNARGLKRRFLLPAVWDPATQACSTSF